MSAMNDQPRAQVERIPTDPFQPWDGTVGDLVVVDHPKSKGAVYRVTKINARSVDVADVTTGAEVRTDRWMLTRATPEQITAANARPKAETFAIGDTATINGKPDDILVVIKADALAGKYNLVKLGGDAGRFYRSVPPAMLTRVTVKAEVTE